MLNWNASIANAGRDVHFTMTLNEEYKQRYLEIKEKYSKAQKQHQKTLDQLLLKKKEILEKHLEKAKLDAEAHFNCEFGSQLAEASSALHEVEVVLRLLRCPEDNNHRKPEGQYYHCELCGFVWDDKSPAHL